MNKNFILVGNPNTGKTTLFNSLTSSEEHTGNWHGVTVLEKIKTFKIGGENVNLIDLPGIYSLTALTPEEQTAINYLTKHKNDIIINTCDINNLQKNLYLTLQLLENNYNVVIFINNMGQNYSINTEKLEEKLGVKIFSVNFENKKEINQIKNNLLNIKLNNKYFKSVSNYAGFQDEIQKKYDFISKLINENIVKKINKKNNKKICKKYSYGEEFLDKILLNKFLAIPIFLLIMLTIFYLTFFSVGSFLSDNLSILIQDKLGGALVSWFSGFCDIPWLNGLVEDGFVGGIGSLVSFLPQIVLLFLFLALLENTGYFARVAFIFEDVFSSIGLSGKSVYTLLMGFGCSASAAVTSKAIDGKNARIKTVMLTPYMSCCAKLPIYAVLCGAFFGGSILIIFLLYMLGVFSALFMSVILDKIGLKSESENFLLEFPPYRIPRFKKVLKLTWLNLKLFLIKITTIFISMNIIIWCLGSFTTSFEYVPECGGISILQNFGQILTPIFAPLGFENWGAVSALIAGIVAKEVVVSSIAIFNGISMKGESANSQIFDSLYNPNSPVNFTPASALSYMSFCLLYCPCLATIAVMKKEIGTKWTVIAVLIQLIFAYVLSFVVYNVYKLSMHIGLLNVALILIAFFVIILSCLKVVSYFRDKNKCKKCGMCSK